MNTILINIFLIIQSETQNKVLIEKLLELYADIFESIFAQVINTTFFPPLPMLQILLYDLLKK